MKTHRMFKKDSQGLVKSLDFQNLTVIVLIKEEDLMKNKKQ